VYHRVEVIIMERVTTVAAREGFSELVNRVAYGRARVVLTRRGRAVALLSPLDAGAADASAVSVQETVAAYGRGPAVALADHRTTINGSQVTTRGSRTSLAGLFASQALADVMRVLLLHSDASFHQRELARLTGAGLRSVQAETRRLEHMGLVISEVSGNRRTYSVDWSHPAADDLRRLFARSFAVPELLRDALAVFGDDIVAALLYGSMARGEDRASSDVDLLVVGDVDGVRLAAALEKPERLLGRTINATVYPILEVVEKRAAGDQFIGSVLEGPIVVVAGDPGRLGA
jgi:prevent-host-death family protein